MRRSPAGVERGGGGLRGRSPGAWCRFVPVRPRREPSGGPMAGLLHLCQACVPSCGVSRSPYESSPPSPCLSGHRSLSEFFGLRPGPTSPTRSTFRRRRVHFTLPDLPNNLRASASRGWRRPLNILTARCSERRAPVPCPKWAAVMRWRAGLSTNSSFHSAGCVVPTFRRDIQSLKNVRLLLTKDTNTKLYFGMYSGSEEDRLSSGTARGFGGAGAEDSVQWREARSDGAVPRRRAWREAGAPVLSDPFVHAERAARQRQPWTQRYGIPSRHR